MLKQRLITAVVLLALLLPALVAPSPWPFAALTLLLIAAAGWEWGRLNAAPQGLAVAFGVGLALVCVAAWSAGWTTAAPPSAWWLATAGWVFGGSAALRAGVAGWPRIATPLRCGLGLVALATAWLAIAGAKAIGVNFLLSIFCLVWVADIAAYFCGRRFGKRKLALSISPGKSWEGACGGMAGALLLAIVWLLVDRSQGPALASASLYTRLDARLGLVGMLVCVALLAAMSVVGDLVESLVKRSAGAKDSSRLLPGHGGVLDRIDALLPVFPIALALATL